MNRILFFAVAVMGLVAYADYLPLAETKPEIVAEDGARVEFKF